jgi:NAD(P)-dependent dehydrogenase (short-subunit alcohol dehydrogenase family)
LESVVVTGASTGIGRELSRVLIERGYRVFGSVRREADERSLQAALGAGFTPLRFDVTDASAVKAAAGEVEKLLLGVPLRGLVNNAGMADSGPLSHMPIERFRQQLEVNVTGALQVTQNFLPLLRGRGSQPSGRIINVSSISGRIVLPFLGAYSASKFALEAISDALRRELKIYGIDVILIEPGGVRTPIWDKAEQTDHTPYADTEYAASLRTASVEMVKAGRTGLPVEQVSACIVKALQAQRPRARYTLPNAWLSGWILPRLLPDRWLDGLLAGKFGLKRLP